MLNLNKEVWKQITKIHEVSNLGNVRNFITKKLLKLQISTTGYYYITIRNYENKLRKHLKVHILVAKAFITPILHKPLINHIDANKLNNVVENLEYCTQKENIMHASKLGLISAKPRTTNCKLGSSSKYHNVTYDLTRNKWCASVCHNKKKVGFRRFNSEEEAAKYVDYLVDLHSLDRVKNFI